MPTVRVLQSEMQLLLLLRGCRCVGPAVMSHVVVISVQGRPRQSRGLLQAAAGIHHT